MNVTKSFLTTSRLMTVFKLCMDVVTPETLYECFIV